MYLIPLAFTSTILLRLSSQVTIKGANNFKYFGRPIPEPNPNVYRGVLKHQQLI